jgi:hypothetical protein
MSHISQLELEKLGHPTKRKINTLKDKADIAEP